MAKSNWKHMGSTHHFRKEPKEPDFGWVGGLVVFFFVAFLISQCTGG